MKAFCACDDPLPDHLDSGEAERSELVDAPIGVEEQVAMMESSEPPPEEGSGGVVNGGGGRAMEVDQSKEGEGEANTAAEEVKVPEEPEPEWMGHLRSIDIILSGNKPIAMHQEFLIRNNNSDLQVLKNTKVH